jgi:hypothetical protein
MQNTTVYKKRAVKDVSKTIPNYKIIKAPNSDKTEKLLNSQH